MGSTTEIVGELLDPKTGCGTLLGELDEWSPSTALGFSRLGVKGSQVQILSARPESGFSQLRGCENPLLLILGSFVQVSTAFGDTLTGGWPYEGGIN